MEEFLRESDVINFSHPLVKEKALSLAKNLTCKEDIAKACFEFVRDEIRHSGDACDTKTTLKASEVLEQETGWCYAKSILLAALLRANKIPTALCYQRLSCSEYNDGVYCLHGLNSVYLESYGWYRIDARGNKEGVDAQFTPPIEKLAFELQDFEFDVEGRFSEPMDEVLQALLRNNTYEKMVKDFPDLKEKR